MRLVWNMNLGKERVTNNTKCCPRNRTILIRQPLCKIKCEIAHTLLAYFIVIKIAFLIIFPTDITLFNRKRGCLPRGLLCD